MPHANTLDLLQKLRNPSFTLAELKTETGQFLAALSRAERRKTELQEALDLADLTEDNAEIRGRFIALSQKLGAMDRTITAARKGAKELLVTMENMKRVDDSIGSVAEPSEPSP